MLILNFYKHPSLLLCILTRPHLPDSNITSSVTWHPSPIPKYTSRDLSTGTCFHCLKGRYIYFLIYWDIIAFQCCVSSAAEQSESALCIHISPASVVSVTTPSHPSSHHRAELPVLHSRFPLAIYFTHGSVYMSVLISQLIPLLSPPCPLVHSVCLHLYSCPVNMLICTIFLDSMYMQ